MDIVKIIPPCNRGSKLLEVYYIAFLLKVEEYIRATPIKQFIECLIVPIFHSPKSSKTVCEYYYSGYACSPQKVAQEGKHAFWWVQTISEVQTNY